MTEEEKGRLRFEYTESVRNIQAWKAHLLRSSNQEEAKQHILQKLDENACFAIMEWAMKFLPVQYREQNPMVVSKGAEQQSSRWT